MRAVYILAAAALVLLLLGQVRVGGQAELGAQGLLAWVRLGWFRLQVFPWKWGGKKKKKKRKKPPAPPPEQPPEPEAPPPEKPKPAPLLERAGCALEYAQTLLPIALEAAGGLWRGLRMDRLELVLTAGAEDPADAAMAYGRATAALGALWQPLTAAFRVKDGTARVQMDFDAGGMTVYASAALSIKLGRVVIIGLSAGARALAGALAVRKRQKTKRRKAA